MKKIAERMRGCIETLSLSALLVINLSFMVLLMLGLCTVLVITGAGLSAFPRGCMEKMDGRGSLRGDHRRSCAGGYDMEKWTGEFGSPLPVGAKDGYGSLSGICGADDGCTGIYGK